MGPLVARVPHEGDGGGGPRQELASPTHFRGLALTLTRKDHEVGPPYGLSQHGQKKKHQFKTENM